MFPVLYSFRRCPYAMRARMALSYSKVKVELREVDLKHKPDAMLVLSEKATVPVLQLTDNRVLDESMDIMHYALAQSDPDGWLPSDSITKKTTYDLIEFNDTKFKISLDHYKYADRFPEYPAEFYREQGEEFLKLLEVQLNDHHYLVSQSISLLDIAVFPFVRQFSFVDRDWFSQSDYVKLNQWLDSFLGSALFSSVMQKYPPWQLGDVITVL